MPLKNGDVAGKCKWDLTLFQTLYTAMKWKIPAASKGPFCVRFKVRGTWINVKLKGAQYVKNTVELLQTKSIIALLLPANEVWGKLMFLLAFLILSMWSGGAHPTGMYSCLVLTQLTFMRLCFRKYWNGGNYKRQHPRFCPISVRIFYWIRVPSHLRFSQILRLDEPIVE